VLSDLQSLAEAALELRLPALMTALEELIHL